MARRRRAAFRRESPDRGWIVGNQSMTLNADASQSTTVFSQLFDFADIDPEALTGRIEQDKSDWFIKRIILDVVASVGLSADPMQATDVARMWACAAITGNNDAISVLQSTDPGVLSPEAYNQASRTMQTWVRPVYAGAIIAYGDDGLVATEAGPVLEYATTAPFWGPARIEADFEVSNAGLRGNWSMGLLYSILPGPGSFDWDVGDALNCMAYYRILVQKRRT